MNIKKGHQLFALIVCLAAFLCAVPAKAQEDPTAMMMDCAICSQIFKEMELIQKCDYQVCDCKEGVLFQINCKDPTMMKRFRDFEKRDMAISRKFKAANAEVCAAKLCPPCAEYMSFLREGLKEERIETPTGTIHVSRTGDAKLLARVHDWTARMRAMMGTCDAAMTESSAAPATESCCGSCGGAESKATCSAEAADPFAQIPEFMLEQMKKCHLCQLFFENPDMMTATKAQITFLDHGIVVTTTVIDPNNIARFHKFEKHFHDRIEKLMEDHSYDEVKKKVCGICTQFCDLAHDGALMDWNVTPTGSISVFYSHEPELVARITGIGRMMESFNTMEQAGK